MGENSRLFLQMQEQHYGDRSLHELGFISRNTTAHYKGQEALIEIQSSRTKLKMLMSEISNVFHSEDDAHLAQSPSYQKLVQRAETEKAHLCSLLDVYANSLNKMADATHEELAHHLDTPVVPETRKNLTLVA